MKSKIPGLKRRSGKSLYPPGYGNVGKSSIKFKFTPGLPKRTGTAIKLSSLYMSNGKISIKNEVGDEVLSINSDNTISILGETFSLEKIKECLSSFQSDRCSCPTNQLVYKGCTCGGK